MTDTPRPLDMIYIYADMAEAMRWRPKAIESRAYVSKDDYDELVAERDALKAEVARLRAALEPFAAAWGIALKAADGKHFTPSHLTAIAGYELNHTHFVKVLHRFLAEGESDEK